MLRSPLLLIAMLSLSVSACGTGTYNPAPHLTTPQVQSQPRELILPLGSAGIIERNDQDRLDSFLNQWCNESRQPLTVTLPPLPENLRQQFIQEISNKARQMGCRSNRIRSIDSVDAMDIRLLYQAFSITPPACLSETAGLGSPKNNASDAFGCSTQNNLSSMLAYPEDLVMPASPYSTNAARGAGVIQKFRKGEKLSTSNLTSDGTSASNILK